MLPEFPGLLAELPGLLPDPGLRFPGAVGEWLFGGEVGEALGGCAPGVPGVVGEVPGVVMPGEVPPADEPPAPAAPAPAPPAPPPPPPPAWADAAADRTSPNARTEMECLIMADSLLK